ncbi:ATP-binding cassette domain-containing protein, partial [bacterium]|nr:ATP-binding cassette domain-containing protein [candidate division CSSED10-310 bacterium]
MSTVLELRNITKRFPGVVANDGISLRLDTGEVLGLLGENGAGKSTLMNILYGLHQPDAGTVLIDGYQRRIRSPLDAIALGIGMVHQHFMLVPVMSVGENMVLGAEPTRFHGILDRAAIRRRVLDISRAYHLEVDPDVLVADLPVGLQQRVEILKALFHDARILILDEPTAVLTPQETDGLFVIVERLRRRGKSVIFITHKLHEVMTVADRIMVLRNGSNAGEAAPGRTSP